MMLRALLLALTFATCGPAQILLLSVVDPLAPTTPFGPVDQVCGPGDLDGDGHADLVFGLSLPAGVTTGGVRAYSGATGNLMWQWLGLPNTQSGTTMDGIGDVDGDGRADLVVAGVGPLGYVAVLRGIDGTLLYGVAGGTAAGFHWGRSVAAIDDVNGDGRRDIVVGAPAMNGLSGGLARVISGANGATLLSVLGGPSAPGFGGTVSGGGDFNGDGTPDFAVSTHGAGTAAAPTVSVHSGVDGTVLWSMIGPATLGRAMDLRRDIDGDGHADLLLGDAGILGLAGQAGTVRVISGATGLAVHTIIGSTSANFGIDVAALGDLDGDGGSEFAYTATTGTINQPFGRMLVHSGVTGAARFEVGGDPLNHVGPAVEAAGDVNADGTDDVLLSWSLQSISSGQITAYAGQNGSGSTVSLGGGCSLPGGPMLAVLPSAPVIGTSLLILISRPPFAIGALFLGFEAPAPIALLDGCATWIDPLTVFYGSWFVGTSGLGVFGAPIPNVAAFVGVTFVAQGLVVDVQGTSWFRMTDANRITIGG